jgi:predicted ATPase
MLRALRIKGFKSLADVAVELPRMAVLFGANSAGKSNLLDAVQALSRIGTLRTLSDALAEPIRGYPVESFSFPPGGLQELLELPRTSFRLGADLTAGKDSSYRYDIEVAIEPGSGRLMVADEYLAQLGAKGDPKGRPPIERVEPNLHIRRKSKPAHPRQEPLSLNHSMLSDPRLGGVEYRALERVRQELSDWRTYYLDPRVAMRVAHPPSEVRDIGVLGGDIAPFLYRLRAEHPKHFETIKRTLRALVPSVEDLTVDLDTRRGTLDILLRQGHVDYSSRIISEGTLRVLALCAIAVNPWGGSLMAIEEPENGVHPRRLELIAQLLLSLALSPEQSRQVVVTTHSPLFCDCVLKAARQHPGDIGLFNVRREGQATVVRPFELSGPLFKNYELAAALTAGTEDGLFESLILRGVIDG